jgi:nucleoside-diphosphate-sugar epimerase/2-polyprenyl-3-methyl-5-hydroxy-6-metoxy-1,4-benzoquinol methylase
MNIFITGGTGFIGSQLAVKCIEDGHVVKILGQENTPAEAGNRILVEAKGGEVILGSVTDKELLPRVLEGMDVVFHLAAAQHEANVPDQRFWDVNVKGTNNLLEASVKAGVRRFVHGSTIGVYGSSTDGPLDEESPVRPDNIYGMTKLEGERAVLSFKETLPVVIIRIPETYGPGDRRLLKLFKAIGKNRFFMIGDGKNLHHVIYIDDLIDSLLRAAESPDAAGNVFVVAGDGPMTTNEMVSAIADQMGVRIPRVHLPFPLFLFLAAVMEKTMRPLGIQPPIHRRRMDFFKKSFSLSPEKAKGTLRLSPKVSFREGVLRTAAWYREMGYLGNADVSHKRGGGFGMDGIIGKPGTELAARIEPFDSFWEAPQDVEKGYETFAKFYRHNYLKYVPGDRKSRILVISCGAGYFVNLLSREGYGDVLGIDSDPGKVELARKRSLNCRVERAFDFLENTKDRYDCIIAEQEINHLTKEEILTFLKLCSSALKPGGRLLVHSLNGANPITGAEALAQNFDHFNTFTEYSLRQILEYSGFHVVKVIPLNLYVFYGNPLNYVAILLDRLNTLYFRLNFKLYGKFNRIFTKKIAAVCQKIPQ